MALVPSGGDPAADCKATIPWSEMFRFGSVRRPKQSVAEEDAPPKPTAPGKKVAASAAAQEAEGLSLEPDARLALYIAMAHAGLATALLVLYGL